MFRFPKIRFQNMSVLGKPSDERFPLATSIPITVKDPKPKVFWTAITPPSSSQRIGVKFANSVVERSGRSTKSVEKFG